MDEVEQALHDLATQVQHVRHRTASHLDVVTERGAHLGPELQAALDQLNRAAFSLELVANHWHYADASEVTPPFDA